MASKLQMHADPHASYFRTRLSCRASREPVWRAICRYLQRYVPPDAAVLDLGAGYCSFINQIAAAEKHAVDVWTGAADHAAPGVTVHIGSCVRLLDLRDGTFDVVFASNLLEHLNREEVSSALAEARRVLKAGGRLILIQPNYRYCVREYFDDYTHVSVFTHLSLRDAVEAAGFEVTTLRPRFMPLTLKSRLPQWSWIVALYLRLPIRPFAKQMLLVGTRA
jgi:SAM-dependent methyltransferase